MTDPSSREDDVDLRVERPRRPLLAFLPVVLFLCLVVGILLPALRPEHDPSRLPSVLIGSKVPSFNLAAVEGLAGKPGLSDADLRQGHVTLVNVFASWCVGCRQEHAVLALIAKDAKLAAEGVSLVGIAWKDEPVHTSRFLAQEGDPYGKIGADSSGMTAIDFGVYGAPETFIVKGDGTIAYKFIGPMNEDSLRDTVLPEIEKARQ